MQSALHELSAAPPHEVRPRGYTPAEWPVYCEGYYCAVTMALQVVELAYQRWKLGNRSRRQDARAARERAGAA